MGLHVGGARQKLESGLSASQAAKCGQGLDMHAPGWHATPHHDDERRGVSGSVVVAARRKTSK